MPDPLRFIILSRGRTGSTFLHRLLDSHPACVCFEELLAPRELPEPPDKLTVGRARAMARDEAQRGTDPVRFLERHVYAPSPGIRATGFKLFYGHSRAGAAAAVWTWLRADRGLRVVHLQRRDVLRMFVSMKIALKTGAWWSLDGEPPLDEKQVVLDPAEFARYLAEVEAQRRHGDAEFAGHPVLRVDYEDFADYDEGGDPAAIDRVQSFLGLPLRRLQTPMHRQNPEPLPALIANFDRFRDALRGTPAARYLDAR